MADASDDQPPAAIPADAEDVPPALEAMNTDEAATEAQMKAFEQMAMRGQAMGKQPKRYAKAMAKMGLKPEPNITRVQIKKPAGMSFSIAKPEVYRFPGTNTFVIFGETQVEEAQSDAQKAAARAVTGASVVPQPTAEPETPAAEPEAPEQEVDAEDLQEKEIEIVMSQASVSRPRAIQALKNNKGDIVNAIMELTM